MKYKSFKDLLEVKKLRWELFGALVALLVLMTHIINVVGKITALIVD